MTNRCSKTNVPTKNDSRNEELVMSELEYDINDFLYIVQSSASKIIQRNESTREVIAFNDNFVSRTTDDREINKKREALKMPFNYQNTFYLPKQNRLDNDEHEERGQAKRSPGPTASNNLAISSSPGYLLNSVKKDKKSTIENMKTDTSAFSTQHSFTSLQSKSTFPQVLHEILQKANDDGYDNIISWQHHGHSFCVKDKEIFVTTIIPRYFNQTRYSSFQRQLALYGFIRYVPTSMIVKRKKTTSRQNFSVILMNSLMQHNQIN